MSASNDLKTCLLNAHGKTVAHDGKRWKLDCTETNAIFPYKHLAFHCNAEDLTPANEEEAKFRFLDLWKSESERAGELILKFAKAGGWVPKKAA